MQSGWALGMVSEKITQSIGLVVRSPRQPASEQLRLAYKITRIRSVPFYRTFALGAPLRLSWPSLYRQFGADPDKAGDNRTVQDFRKDSLRELKKIKMAWLDCTMRRPRAS